MALRRLALPSILFLALLLAWGDGKAAIGELPWRLSDAQSAGLDQAMAVALLLALGLLVIRGLDVFLWKGWIGRRHGQVPRMLTDLAGLLVWLVMVVVILSTIFDRSVGALITTSTVALGVAGFAVQKLISDFFSGIALSVERPFSIGDWIQIDGNGTVGKVVEQTWRATRVITQDDILVVVPNNYLASTSFRNFSRPEAFFRDEILVPLPFEVTSHQAQRILVSAADQIDEITRIPHKTMINIVEYTAAAIVWKLQFWVPNYAVRGTVRFKVHRNILRNLHYAGISLPVAVREIRQARPAPLGSFDSAILKVLRQAPLFAAVSGEDLTMLAAGAQQVLYNAHEPIVRQGDPGSSLFLLNEGLLAVYLSGAESEQNEVGRIYPGNFFGEMSLLTGVARSATVIPLVDSMVTEIGRDTMADLLKARPAIAETLSLALAERQTKTASYLAEHSGAGQLLDKRGVAQQILGRILTFFNMRG